MDHPPARGGHYLLGTLPMVHAGFLQSWHVRGLNLRVLERVQSIVAAGGGDRTWRIRTTGHSLGGALATLAAYDVAAAFQGNPRVEVRATCLPAQPSPAYTVQLI